jgi:hypothetical protein
MEDRFGARHPSLPGKGRRKAKSRQTVKRDGLCENAAAWLDSAALLIVSGHLRGRLTQLNSIAHLLDLCCLLF